MNKVTAFLPPWANNQDAKHKLKRVKSLLLRQCPRALRHQTKEPLDDQLSDPTRSRENLVCEYKHPQSMAPVGDWSQVLQTSRTCSLHAERRLSVHAGPGRQNNSGTCLNPRQKHFSLKSSPVARTRTATLLQLASFAPRMHST